MANSMTRVLIVYHAGCADSTYPIYEALCDAGDIDLTVIVPERLKVDPVYHPSGWLQPADTQPERYRLIALPLRDPTDCHKGFEPRALRGALKRARADVIHVMESPHSGYLLQVVWQRLQVCPGAKVLFYGFENLPLQLSWRSRIKWRLTWQQMAGGAVASTEAAESYYRAGFPRHRPIERIFWGIPTGIFKPMDGISMRRELGIEARYVVGFVGRLVPEKGPLVLLDAMRRLPQETHCIMIGEGPSREEIERETAGPELRGRVHLHGAMKAETLARYMNCFDVLAVPSLTTTHWTEQYGRVIAEAMACGVPVVGSDSGAIPEVIGEGGSIVPEGNPGLLSQSLAMVIHNKEVGKTLKEKALQRADAELGVNAMARHLIRFYKRIACTER